MGQVVQGCQTPKGNWVHLTVDGQHPVCDRTKEAVEVFDLELNEAQKADVGKHGSTVLAQCYRCEKWRKSYVRRATYRALAGLS